MSYLFRLNTIIFFAIIFCFGCSSTEKSSTEKASSDKSNLSWQERIISKFEFHSAREHRQLQKEKDRREREEQIAQYALEHPES